MKVSNIQSPRASVRLFATVALVASLAFAPGFILAADKDVHEDRAEQRIKHMHVKLMITPAQEEQWSKVAVIMTENGKTMDSLTQARADHAKEMTAVDALKSYGEITDTHANGIKKLTPEFATLYASMSDAQKKEADTLFRHGDGKRGHHKHAHQKPDSK